MGKKIEFKTVDEYIASFPENTQKVLQEIRQVVKKSAPQAKEVISYKIPALELNGILVWYAAFKNHIGFYPKTGAMEAFKKELSGYETSKGTIRFPLNKPMPLDLIRKIVKYRVKKTSPINNSTHQAVFSETLEKSPDSFRQGCFSLQCFESVNDYQADFFLEEKERLIRLKKL